MNTIKVSLLAIIVSFIFACKTDPKIQENVIHIRIKKDPERINPLIFPNPTAREIYQYIHLPMADYDPNTLTLSPLLIKEIPTEMAIDTGKYKGGIAFDIEFIAEAKWDNGAPITGDDFLFTLKAINLPSTNAGKYRDFTKHISEIIVDPANKKKFRVIFAEDYMLALETAINLEVYPKYFYDSLDVLGKYEFHDFTEKNADKLNADSTLVKFASQFNSNTYSRDKINGSGPYRFVSWTADQNIILEKKPNYWAKAKNQPLLQQGPDKMVFHIIPDEVTAVTQLKAGSIDLINEISGDYYENLEQDPAINQYFSFYHPALMKQYYILLNNGDFKLKDVRVRKALAHLVDNDNIIKNIEKNKGTKSVSPIHPLKKTFNASLTPIEFDIEKAKTLLADAGWSDGDGNGILDRKVGGKSEELELELLISGHELGKKIAIILQENATKAGIKIKITEKDFKLIRAEHIKTRKYQLIPSVLSQDLQAWDDLSKWHSENDIPDGSNETSYRNPEVDKMIDQIIHTKNDDQRMELYKKIQSAIYEDQPVIFMYAPEERIIISKKWTSSATVKRPGYLANTFKYSGAGISIPK